MPLPNFTWIVAKEILNTYWCEDLNSTVFGTFSSYFWLSLAKKMSSWAKRWISLPLAWKKDFSGRRPRRTSGRFKLPSWNNLTLVLNGQCGKSVQIVLVKQYNIGFERTVRQAAFFYQVPVDDGKFITGKIFTRVSWLQSWTF